MRAKVNIEFYTDDKDDDTTLTRASGKGIRILAEAILEALVEVSQNLDFITDAWAYTVEVDESDDGGDVILIDFAYPEHDVARRIVKRIREKMRGGADAC